MGEKAETVTDVIFLDSKITVDGDCSHKIKRRLLLERKVMNTLLKNKLFEKYKHIKRATDIYIQDRIYKTSP